MREQSDSVSACSVKLLLLAARNHVSSTELDDDELSAGAGCTKHLNGLLMHSDKVTERQSELVELKTMTLALEEI